MPSEWHATSKTPRMPLATGRHILAVRPKGIFGRAPLAGYRGHSWRAHTKAETARRGHT